MNDTTITGLPTASGVDPVADWIPIDRTALNVTQKINRNTYLGITGSPVGTTDTQTLTNKTITSPAISSPVLSGTITGTYTLGGTPTFPSTVVRTTATQTLTNKTLTNPTINGGSIDSSSITVDTISGKTSPTSGSIFGLPITSGKVGTNGVVTNSITDNSVTAVKTNFGGNYSTSEVNTGFTWIDGKDIYKRTFVGTSSGAASTDVTITPALGSVDTICNIEGWAELDSGSRVGLGTQTYSSGTINVFRFAQVLYSSGSIRLRSGSAWSNTPYAATYFYTKP